jgi:hypothetical protein
MALPEQEASEPRRGCRTGGGAPVSEESGDGQPAVGAARRAGRQMQRRRMGRGEERERLENEMNVISGNMGHPEPSGG